MVSEVPTDNNWSQRNAIILPKLSSASHIFRDSRELNTESLALIKPKTIIDLEIEETPDADFIKQVANLNAVQQQLTLFDAPQIKPLELIPYSFRYEFIDDADKYHKMKVVDWEIYQLYRNVRYKDNWKELIRYKYLTELTRKELHFFLGTMHQHPQNWIIIGVYYPMSIVSQPNMFDSQF